MHAPQAFQYLAYASDWACCDCCVRAAWLRRAARPPATTPAVAPIFAPSEESPLCTSPLTAPAAAVAAGSMPVSCLAQVAQAASSCVFCSAVCPLEGYADGFCAEAGSTAKA